MTVAILNDWNAIVCLWVYRSLSYVLEPHPVFSFVSHLFWFLWVRSTSLLAGKRCKSQITHRNFTQHLCQKCWRPNSQWSAHSPNDSESVVFHSWDVANGKMIGERMCEWKPLTDRSNLSQLCSYYIIWFVSICFSNCSNGRARLCAHWRRLCMSARTFAVRMVCVPCTRNTLVLANLI